MNEFREEHVGQQVYCHLVCLGGVITRCNHTVVEVSFHNDGVACYTLTGVKIGCNERSLTFKNGKIVYDFGTHVPTYRALEFTGNPVWCFAGDSEIEVCEKQHVRQLVIAYFEGRYISITDGSANADSAAFGEWEYATELTSNELEYYQLCNDAEKGFLK